MSSLQSRERAPERAALEVTDLEVEYATPAGLVHAVSGVSFTLRPGETLAIVGESGCGKSSLVKSILQLTRPRAGSVTIGGEEMTEARGERLRKLRSHFHIVFQDPLSSLNPRRKVRDIVAEPLSIWNSAKRGDRAAIADAMLDRVGLDSRTYATRRPGQLSGGQAQRVAIARALVAGVDVLICDEAISSLDVSLRARVLNLLRELGREFNFSMLFIAHDLAVVKNIAERTAVMYLGRIVEEGPTAELFAAPRHPYTRALLESVPIADPRQKAVVPLKGDPPSPINLPSGCAFRGRCPLAQEICAVERPPLVPAPGDVGRAAACHFPLGVVSPDSRLPAA